MFSLIKCGVPLLSILPVRVLVVILSYLDPQSLFNVARTWKSIMIICRNDKVLSRTIREQVKTQKTRQPVPKPIFYQATPLLRQQDREQFKIPRKRLYRVILDEERKRGGEEFKVPKRAVRYQPYSKSRGIRI